MKALTRKEALIMGEDVKPLSRSDAFIKGADIPAITRKEQMMKDREGGGTTPPDHMYRTCKIQVKNSQYEQATITIYTIDEYGTGTIELVSELTDRGVTEIEVPIPHGYSYDWGGPKWLNRYPLLLEYSIRYGVLAESYVDYGDNHYVSLIKTYGNNNYLIAPVQDTATVFLDFNYEETAN